MESTGRAAPGGLTGFRSQKIYRDLLGRIRRRYRPGQRLGTQVELAQQFGVSDKTMQGVLRALARDGVVVRTRGLGTTVADHSLLWGRRIGVVGLPPGRFWDRSLFYSDLFVPLMATLSAAGAAVQLLDTNWLDELRRQGELDPPGSSDAVRRLADIDALAVVDPPPGDLLERIGRTMPTVAVNIPPAAGLVSYMAIDHMAGVKWAVDHLWKLGHRRIGCWGQLYVRESAATGAGNHEERYDAFVQILSRRLGQPPDRDWIRMVWDARSWREAADRWMKTPPAARPTAILCRGGTWALLWELVRSGVRIGRDVSVLGLERMVSLSDCLDSVERQEPWWGYPHEGLRGLDIHSSAGRRMAALIPAAVIPDARALGLATAEELLRRNVPGGAPPRRRLVGSTFREGNTTGPVAV